MITGDILTDFQVTVPASAHTLEGFRAWAASDGFPERGKISFFAGEVFVDMSRERVESHNQVKAEIGSILTAMVRSQDLGKYYPDGLWITNDDADLSTEPDGTFVAWDTLEAGRVKTAPWGATDTDGLEMTGSPDWVLEVVSKSSFVKDTRTLRTKYHIAGVREYWIIDARGEDILFTMLANVHDGFVEVEPTDGWRRSEVFGREFLLERQRDRIGGWQYTLRVRD